jgi:hypothetical protein
MVTKLMEHRRRGHLSVKGEKVICPDCDLGKGAKKSFEKQRDPKYRIAEPMQQLNADFYGPVKPESIRNHAHLLVFLCDAVAFAIVEPVRSKSECVVVAKRIIMSIRAKDTKQLGEKIVCCVRSDNAAEHRSQRWDETLRELGVEPMHSTPYGPPQNGVVERYMRTMGNLLRCNLLGVDRRLWCYCAQYVAHCWNRQKRDYPRAPAYNGLTPKQAREARGDKKKIKDFKKQGPDSEKYFRRFGCAALVLDQPREEVPKLAPKKRRMVFLGFSGANSAWLFGCWNPDKKAKTGLSWQEYESRDADFREDDLIGNIDETKPGASLPAGDGEPKAVCQNRSGGSAVMDVQPCAQEADDPLSRRPQASRGALAEVGMARKEPAPKFVDSNDVDGGKKSFRVAHLAEVLGADHGFAVVLAVDAQVRRLRRGPVEVGPGRAGATPVQRPGAGAQPGAMLLAGLCRTARKT